MGFWETLAGNLLVAVAFTPISIILLMGICGPLSKIIGIAIDSLTKLIPGMEKFSLGIGNMVCGTCGPFIQPVVALFMLPIVWVLAFFTGFDMLSIIVAGFITVSAVGGVFLHKIPPPPPHLEIPILKVPIATDKPKYNVCHMLFIVLLFYYFIFKLYVIGAIIGVLLMILFICVLGVVLMLTSEFWLPAVDTLVPVAGEAVGGAVGSEVTTGAAGTQALGAMSETSAAEVWAAPETAEVTTAETPTAAIEEEAAEEEAKLKERGETPRAAPETHTDVFGKLSGAHAEHRMKHRAGIISSVAKDPRKGKREEGPILKRDEEAVGSSTWLIILAVVIVALIVLGLMWKFNIFWIQDWGSDITRGIETGLRWAWDQILSAFWYVVSKAVPTSVMGVPLRNPFKFETCYPFCISESGEAESWRGFSITRLDIIPSTIYDYQKFSVIAEFANEGSGDATFEPPIKIEGVDADEVQPGSLSLACVETECEIDILLGLATFGEKWQKCKEVCPLEENQDVSSYITGTCAKIKPGDDCVLAPQDVTQLRWYGLSVNENAVHEGQVLTPEISLELEYTFKPTTDLIGNLVVTDIVAQVTEVKKEKRIANKITKSYSPTGPLMLAMGTAEDSVVSSNVSAGEPRIPTLFMIQFANKGKGTLTGIDADDMRLYVPKGFVMMDELKGTEGTCDFIDVSSTESKDFFTNGIDTNEYYIFRPKEGIPELEHSYNPMENPTRSCVFFPPTIEEKGKGPKTYTFKFRVKEYTYKEEAKTYLKIIGTGLEVVPLLEENAAFKHVTGGNSNKWSIEFDHEYRNVVRLNAFWRRTSSGWNCEDKAYASFYAYDANGNIVISTDKTPGAKKGKWSGVEKRLDTPVSVKKVEGKAQGSGGTFQRAFQRACDTIKEMKITLVYRVNSRENEECLKYCNRASSGYTIGECTDDAYRGDGCLYSEGTKTYYCCVKDGEADWYENCPDDEGILTEESCKTSGKGTCSEKCEEEGYGYGSFDDERMDCTCFEINLSHGPSYKWNVCETEKFGCEENMYCTCTK